MKKLLLIAAALAAGIATAQAAPVRTVGQPTWGEARSVVVRYEDLNLSSAQGAADLRRRIEVAVDLACALPGAHLLSQRTRVAECRSFAHRQADERAARLIAHAQAVARSK